MPYDLHPGALVAAFSGVALAALGLAVLRLRPWKASGLAFSTFAVLWGAQVTAASISRMAPAETVYAWTLLLVALAIPLYVPLLYFVSAYPWPSNRLAQRPALLAFAAAPAGALLVLLAAAPGWFVESARVTDTGLRVATGGPLFEVATVGNGIIAFTLALLIAARKLFAESRAASLEQRALVVAALLTYVSFQAAWVVNIGVLNAGPYIADRGLPAYILFAGAALAALLAVGWVLMRVARTRGLPWRDLLFGAGLLPFAFGVAQAVAAGAGVRGFDTVGLWRLAMVALFAYAIARFRLFSVEVRLRDVVPAAEAVLAAAVGLGGLWLLAGDALARQPVFGVLAAVGVAAMAVPVRRLGPRTIRRLAPQVNESDYVYKRKVDVYRAALEEAEARGAGERTEQVFLSELRRSLGISEPEHRLLLLFLRSQERFAAPVVSKDKRFRVERELGRGSFGRAVLAHDTVLDRKVVLKQPVAPWLLEGEGRELFLREARLGARLQHPNVVTVYEVLTDTNPPSLVMEYVPGGSLEDLLAREPRLPPERALAIAAGVLAGLECIHRLGIVHRDIKPSNILLDAEGAAKVTDFGIARPPPQGARVLTAATGTSQPGSLAYMSPEQARGEPVDARTDLFAAGAVLYRMLAGRHYVALRGMTEFRARQVVAAGATADLAGLPEGLAPVLAKALAADPDLRYASAAEMAKALRAASAAVHVPPRARRARR